LADPGGRTAENHGALKSRCLRMVSSSRAPPRRKRDIVQSLSAAAGCEVDLARNNQITESGSDLGCRNKHRSLTHDALMIFCPLTRKSPCEVFGTQRRPLLLIHTCHGRLGTHFDAAERAHRLEDQERAARLAGEVLELHVVARDHDLERRARPSVPDRGDERRLAEKRTGERSALPQNAISKRTNG